MIFYVMEDLHRAVPATIHEPECPDCNHGLGKSNGLSTSTMWHKCYGEVSATEKAISISGDKAKDCGNCKPGAFTTTNRRLTE